MSWRSIRRVVSFCFLLFVLMDLTVPGFCRTDEIPIGGVETSTGQAGFPDEADHSTPDDCFCCCIHIKAEPHFNFPQALAAVERIDPLGVPVTDGDPQLLFHPPQYL